MSQKEDIYERARELGIVSGMVNGSQLDTLQAIAKEVGMDHYNGLSNDDTDELQRRLKEYEQNKSESNSPRASQNMVNRGLNTATGGAWNKARNSPIVGGATKKAEDKLANRFGNTRLGQAMDNRQKKDIGSQNLKKSLSNRTLNLWKKNSGKSSTNTSDNSNTDDNSKNEEATVADDIAIVKRKILIIKIALLGLGLFAFFFVILLIAEAITGGNALQSIPVTSPSNYGTSDFETITDEDSPYHDDEIAYYKKLKTIEETYGESVNINYVNALLMQLYYERDYETDNDELIDETGGIDFANMTQHADEFASIINATGSMDYAIDGPIFQKLKGNSTIYNYYKNVMKTTTLEDILKRAFDLGEELDKDKNIDATVITTQTQVVVTGNGNNQSQSMTIKEYLANSIYASTNSLEDVELVKAYTIAYSTNLAAKNNKLTVDTTSITASNSLCNISLGCSYDDNGNLISGSGKQNSKNTFFYKGGYYYKKPLENSNITSLNANVDTVFGNVLVNADGTYPTLDINKINGLGDYKTILINSYGNLTIKNIGEDSYILDGSYGTELVKTNVIFYDQNDYGSYTFCGKKRETIKTSGCGTTSMAMIVSTYENNSKYNPVLMMNEAYKTGYCGGGIVGTSQGFFKKEASTMKYKYYKANKYSKKDLNLVLKHLSERHLVIAHMSPGHFTSGGHYMVLGGVDPNTKKVYVYDPYNRVNKSYRKTGNGWYSFNDIIVKEAWAFYIIWKG